MCERKGSMNKNETWLQVQQDKKSTVFARLKQTQFETRAQQHSSSPRATATTRPDKRRVSRQGVGEESGRREGPDDRVPHVPARSGRRLTSGTYPTEPGPRSGPHHALTASLPQTRSHQPDKTWLRRSRSPRKRAEEVFRACLGRTGSPA